MGEVKIFDRLPTAAPGGGYLVTDQAAIDAQRGVVWDLIKQLGKTITDGGSLTKIAVPVNISEPRSYLERLCDGEFSSATDDPLERLKLVVTFAVAGLSNTCTAAKPFNPILGETYEGFFDDGTKIFVEQSTHHPPITNWEVIGPDNSYHFYGFGEWTASFRGNSLKGQQLGNHIIAFPDGTKIEYNLPDAWVRGVMLGERIIEYDGQMTFIDRKSKLVAQLTFNPDSGNWFWSAKAPNDHFKGIIAKGTIPPDPKNKLCDIAGSWLGCVEFNGTKYWNWKDDLPKFNPTAVEAPLPSDCRYREDIIHLKNGDVEAAGEWKRRLEEKQRAEARLRTEYAKKMGFEPREH